MTGVLQGTLDGHGPFAVHAAASISPAAQQQALAKHQSDLKACAAAIRKGSKSFHLASLILPGETRKAARALYAFCRHSDDLIDDPRSDGRALDQLRGRLNLIYEGKPADYACDRAFHRTVDDYAIPKCIPDALLDGFALDIGGARYTTIDDVKHYATCVAATVGLMMALVMRTGDRNALARAADLGIAMQLTNIARDVGEDARNGRIYLPSEWMRDEGLDADEFLANPEFSPALGRVVKRLLNEADHHYRLGHAGIEALPANCRHAIRTAALVYEEIGAEVRASGYDSVTRRAFTTNARKLALLVKARRAAIEQASAASAMFHSDADPSAARLVNAGARAFKIRRIAQQQCPETVPDDTNLERFLTILIRLQKDSQQQLRHQKLAARQRAENIA
ncbi:phytoene/squalene synthase family protein [Roseibium denhamense]|uniref:Phytoene synthase n=1 Tax=Roseibium denhamense TaxID=76305 RepID=A0ABY1PM45_9HYPH|nr:phytoene/squalene synthase family protein [Roseibium denhamense]MTI07059.1 phytoene/squalene synthase family protein [Roseibium denhamense]SMP36488.1 phytoene synthase [Roseibium denhamense]